MGKSEILMLLAGVALSIMLAMVAIPMFSSGSEMADRQQVQQELLAIKSAIPLIKGMEGDDNGTIIAKNIAKHMEGFTAITSGTGPTATITGLEGKDGKASFTITDNTPDADKVTIVVSTDPLDAEAVDLSKFARLNKICDGVATTTPTKNELTCIIKR